jgi:hypothetical protein
MNKFSKQNIDKTDFFAGDDGITIDNLLELIKESEYFQNILNYFQIEENDTTKINIPGAKTLFTILNSSNKKLRKEDIKVELQNIKFDYSGKFGIVFKNIEDNEYLKNKNINSLKAYPIHSAQKDFFSNLYDIDKYASKLLNNGFKDILDYNLELLKQKKKHQRKYRLIYDTDVNIFYLRAIVSTDRYYNYDNAFTIVVALLKLHLEMLTSTVEYELQFFEYNESFIRLYFKTSELKELKGIGYLENTLLVSNDEIKREALRFSNICTIRYVDSNKNEQRLLIKPKDIKTKVITIPHGTGVEKAFLNLEDFTKSSENFEKLFKEVDTITKIQNHNQIVHLVKSKINNSNTDEIKKFKSELTKILLVDIKTTTQLLETFNKLVFLEGLEIDAKEYLRYILYEALIDRR